MRCRVILGKFLVKELNNLDGFDVVRIWNRTVDQSSTVLPLEQIVADRLK